MKLPLFLLALAGVFGACSAPEILEAGAACHNGVDDDSDGATDCSDLGCTDSDLCERTHGRCDDGIDQDGDGLTDCEDPDCRSDGYCEEQERSCNVLMQAGCPVGLACYSAPGGTVGVRCVLPGTKAVGVACLGSPECAPPAVCGGICLSACSTNSDCPRNSQCIGGGEVRSCSLSCVPAQGDEACGGLKCITTHQLLYPLPAHTAYAWCATPVAWQGRVPVDGPCDDPPATTRPPDVAALSRMCAPGLVCLPDTGNTGNHTCRGTCALREDGTVATACPANRRCYALFSTDTRTMPPGAFVPGLCVP